MLKERIRTDCGNGDNCSQVILRAVAEEYGISLSEELFCACRGIHGGFGGCDQLGTVGQTQVVVGAEVDDFPPVGQGDFGSLRGSDDAFFLEQAGLPDLVQFLLKVFLQFVVHGFRIFLKGFLE